MCNWSKKTSPILLHDGSKSALEEADLRTVMDGLNVLGKVPWAINKKILNVAQRCWDEGIALGDIPSRTDFELPPMPIRPEGGHIDYVSADGDFRRYRDALSKYRRIHQRNMDLRSLRCSALLKLNQAHQFKDFEKIYFPYNVDFRGRAYPVPPHLSNIGSDLCRGVLTFAESKPLGPKGLYWMKVHLANLAGNDKITFDQRAEFTENNMDNIRAAVEDPFGENRWWMTLDDPFQALATCHEIVNAIDSGDPENYESSLPVHMDGSCNGLQHYAALGRDRVGGKAVNLCAYDVPQDVYSGVMREVIKRVAEEAERIVDIDATRDDLTKVEREALANNRAAKLTNGLIDRGVVKRTVMTSVYGVTYIGAKKQIQEKIEEKVRHRFGFKMKPIILDNVSSYCFQQTA
jgi:Mitochondrial DNA-directed RNA polymerase